MPGLHLVGRIFVTTTADVDAEVERYIDDYEQSHLRSLIDDVAPVPLAIKYVPSMRAAQYRTPAPLWISSTPALTWGTATYVAPLAFPLSSALYGRVGLVAPFDPTGWRLFDATSNRARDAYICWARTQPDYRSLVLTVHSTYANHAMRDRFKRRFAIDCVTFRPDQRAELHTNERSDVWMAVTDWVTSRRRRIAQGPSQTFGRARATVLVDEEFRVTDDGLPVRSSPRMIEAVTEQIAHQSGYSISAARSMPSLPADIARHYQNDGYVHLWIAP
jgi:hypothetical protein